MIRQSNHGRKTASGFGLRPCVDRDDTPPLVVTHEPERTQGTPRPPRARHQQGSRGTWRLPLHNHELALWAAAHSRNDCVCARRSGAGARQRQPRQGARNGKTILIAVRTLTRRRSYRRSSAPPEPGRGRPSTAAAYRSGWGGHQGENDYFGLASARIYPAEDGADSLLSTANDLRFAPPLLRGPALDRRIQSASRPVIVRIATQIAWLISVNARPCLAPWRDKWRADWSQPY